MSAVLDTAKRIERDQSSTTHVTIRLALLQDLIGEIERLAEVEQTLAGKSLKLVRKAAAERGALEDSS